MASIEYELLLLKDYFATLGLNLQQSTLQKENNLKHNQ
jgi:hypothetical protein